ncbi:hypothetical protein MRX96_039414 [Rhipicephalus microplus]
MSTMTDLRSSHRMMKTGCIIFFPLGLTSLIAALSLVYITAMHDQHYARPHAGASVAERHATDVHDAATTPRWISEATPVHSTSDKRINAEDQAETSLSPFYGREGDMTSKLGNPTRGVATGPSLGASEENAKTSWLAVADSRNSSKTTAKKVWFPVSTRRKSTRSPKVISTVRWTHPFSQTVQRIDFDSLDNEDMIDIDDHAHKGKSSRTSRNAATSDREYRRTTDLLDLLGVLDTSAPLVNLSGSAKRGNFTKEKTVHDVTNRRYRLQSVGSTRSSWKRPTIGKI